MKFKKPTNKQVKKIIKITGNVFVVFIFLIALLMIFSRFNFTGVRVLAVKSGSMSPTIFVGSTIFDFPASTYDIGDIITFRAQGQKELITHRIVDINQMEDMNYFRTEGDANEVPDSYLVPQNGIIGKVRFSIPLLGYITEFSKTIVGLVLLIIIPATIIVYEEISKIKKEWNKAKRKKTKRNSSSDLNP